MARTSYGAGLPPVFAAASLVRYVLGCWLPSYVSAMSAPYVSLTYFWNCFTSSSLAVYVQLPTTTLPSLAISALISSSVMSLLRIETCLVPAAALPDAAGEPAALAIALAAADAGPLASGCELQAAATSAMTANSAATARDHRRVPMVCTETALLLVRSATPASSSVKAQYATASYG